MKDVFNSVNITPSILMGAGVVLATTAILIYTKCCGIFRSEEEERAQYEEEVKALIKHTCDYHRPFLREDEIIPRSYDEVDELLSDNGVVCPIR